MKWLSMASPLLRDIGITVTGLGCIWLQLLLWAIRDRPPSDEFIGTGLVLLGYPLAVAIRTVFGVTRGEAGPSSESPSSPSSSPSSPSSPREGAPGER